MREKPLILIVDDEPFNVDYLEQELEDLDYDTVSAMDGREALDQVAATAPDMILLDIMMPVMDGFAVLDRLKKDTAWRDIPVVVISAMSDINSISRGIEAGAEDYLPKPFDPVLLESRLKAGLEKKRLRDQEVEYLRQVAHLTAAAKAIEENSFAAEALAPVAARGDALGNLGRVFLRMAEEVHQREQRLQQQIAQLQLDMAERAEAAGETADVYLPMDRRQALAAGVDLPSRAEGAALFADVSGFTPLTAVLEAELGRQRGAEELVRQLNRVFSALVSEVHAFRGSVTGFSGDAMTCWFAEGQEGEALPPAGLRAAACALALQEAMRPFAAIATAGGQTISMGIKVAVAGGSVRRFLPGDPRVHVLEALAGRVLDRVAAGEHLAQTGEVLLGADLAAALGEALHLGEARGEAEPFVVLRALSAETARTPWPELPAGSVRAQQARSWLLGPVYEQVRAGQSAFLSQLRPAAALFLHFAGIDYDEDEEAGACLDSFVRWVQGVLHEQDGQLLDLIIGDKGSYLYAVFGTPVALEEDAARAVAAALQLLQPPEALSFVKDIRIGVTRGLMRSGAYGSPARRTYSALGDVTNMAARLMMAGGEGIRVDEAVYALAKGAFEFEALPPAQVKGREEPLAIFRPLGGRSRALLQRRLDQLAPRLQTMIKTASVLDGAFSAEWAAAICPDEAAAEQAGELLAQLASLELLAQEEDGRYHFADPLLRETAYETMLFAQRRQLHRAAAAWLEERHAQDLAACYDDLARHWQGAEDTEKTIRYLELAAEQARAKGDLDAALAYFNKTLKLQAQEA